VAHGRSIGKEEEYYDMMIWPEFWESQLKLLEDEILAGKKLFVDT